MVLPLFVVFLYTPEDDNRRFQQRGYVFAVRGVIVVRAQRNVEHLVIGERLNLLGNGTTLFGVGGRCKFILELLHFFAFRPARIADLSASIQVQVRKRREQVKRVPAAIGQAPAAFLDRFLTIAARQQRRPVHGLHFDVHADGLQRLNRHRRDGGYRRIVGGMQHHGFLVGIAGFFQKLAGPLIIGLDGGLYGSNVCSQRSIATKQGTANGVGVGVANLRIHEVGLTYRVQQGLP